MAPMVSLLELQICHFRHNYLQGAPCGWYRYQLLTTQDIQEKSSQGCILTFFYPHQIQLLTDVRVLRAA